MGIKIGHSEYLPLGKLNKLNRPARNDLNNLYKIYLEALIMLKDGNYSDSKMNSKFPGKPYLKNIDFTKPFYVFSSIEPEIWIELQSILKDTTGRIWEMDVFLDLMIGWFIKAYSKREVPKLFPLKLKKKRKRKFNLIDKFNKEFSPFYKNMMKEWE